MKFDSYPRFLKSDLYRQCVVSEMEGTSLPFDDEKRDKNKLLKKVHLKVLSVGLPSTWCGDHALSDQHVVPRPLNTCPLMVISDKR